MLWVSPLVESELVSRAAGDERVRAESEQLVVRCTSFTIVGNRLLLSSLCLETFFSKSQFRNSNVRVEIPLESGFMSISMKELYSVTQVGFLLFG